ncbi:MAG TPA: hypothetical protein VMS56_12355 [Thermoanaerobaculia bacterium]|nr:hypothetical protein [Thermoanaerobaculia bacterium]
MVRRLALVLALLLPLGCGGNESPDRADRGSFRKGPVSIRGWFAEIDAGAPPPEVFSVTEPNARISPHQSRLFEQTSISLEDVPYASGGVADNGSFIILDAPPGRLTINMQAPGVPLVQMNLESIPANADVFIPGIRLLPDRFEILEPEKILIRVPTRGSERRMTGQRGIVGGHPVEIWEVPLREMMDRRDWPVPT